MSSYEMVVAIVAIAAIASVMRAKYGIVRRGRGKNREEMFIGTPQSDAESERLRSEVRTLKDRIAVLERIATENNRAVELDREIEKLR